jgi:hypothetical protein
MLASVREPCDENIILSAAAAAPCSKRAGRWVLAATILGSSMGFIDGTVVNVALPALALDKNMDRRQYRTKWNAAYNRTHATYFKERFFSRIGPTRSEPMRV